MNISLIGTGLMGLPLAQRLIDAGFTVTAYNRTPAKLEPLKAAGATIVATPEAAIQASDCTILMLADAPAIQAVILTDAVKPVLSGRTIIQMGTISPTESKGISEQIIAAGGEYLEAPVLGSTPEAKTGKLFVLVGGTPEQFQCWLSVFKTFSPEPQFIGTVGQASALKLALNQLIGSLTTAFAVSLGFIQNSGVNVEDFMTILRKSALYAPTFDKKLQRMLDRNYENPNFPTKHLLKDVNLCLGEAELLGLDQSLLVAVQSVLEKTLEKQLQDADYSALFEAVVPVNPD